MHNSINNFPIETSLLSEFLPHRPPFVWVDKVLALTETTGLCSVSLDKEKNYCHSTEVRPSSYIEWMAQAYAFCGILRTLRAGHSPHLQKAFLAAFTHFQIFSPLLLQQQPEIHLFVEKKRELGPISLIDGKVQTPAGEAIASASLKLFAE